VQLRLCRGIQQERGGGPRAAAPERRRAPARPAGRTANVSVGGDGRLLPDEELRAVFAAHGGDGERSVITYCRIGERSAHTWFVLREILDLPDVRNYDGSWTEWGSMVGMPIELGAATG